MGGWGGPLRQASTVEDLVGRRKRLHLAAAANLRDELVYGADERAERLGRLLERRRAGTADLLRGAMSNVGLPQADAGVGTASDATIGLELGCDGILMNTAIAEAKDPIRMATAMKHAVIAGREAYLAGRMPRRMYADPSSPLAGLI